MTDRGCRGSCRAPVTYLVFSLAAAIKEYLSQSLPTLAMRSGILLCILLLCIIAFGAAHANRASRRRASAGDDDDDDVPAAPAPSPALATQAPVSADILLDRQKKQALMQQQRSSSKLSELREKEASLLDEIIRENQANMQRDGNPNSVDSSSDISRSRTRGTFYSTPVH